MRPGLKALGLAVALCAIGALAFGVLRAYQQPEQLLRFLMLMQLCG